VAPTALRPVVMEDQRVLSKQRIKSLIPAGLVSSVIALAVLAPAGPLATLFASYGYGVPVSGGGVLTSGPDAGVPSAASEDVFVRGTDNAVYRNHWDGSTFSGWTRGGGIL